MNYDNEITKYALQIVSFLEQLPDVVVVFDQSFSIKYTNPAFHKDLVEPASDESDFRSYLDGPSQARLRQGPLPMGGNTLRIDLSMQRADAKNLTVHFTFSRVVLPGITEQLIVGFGRDRAGDLKTLIEVIELNLELGRREKELQEASARLELLAITDQLTQLYNRYYFYKAADELWERVRRENLPLSAMMIDIDDFKSINDEKGHFFADEVLKACAARMKGLSRKTDVLARFGGEELILLAAETDMAAGLQMAEQLRSIVASHPFVFESDSQHVTISVGVSSTEMGDFTTLDAFLKSCDRAMYEAKRMGKNRVCSYKDLK